MPSRCPDWNLEAALPPKRTRAEAVADSMNSWRNSPAVCFTKLRAQLFRNRCAQPQGLMSLLNGYGLQEIIEPLKWTFRVLSEYLDKTTTETPKVIPLNRILSHIWMPARLARIFSYPKSTKPPPVYLEEIRFLGESFYCVSDGNHRCEAAKTRGVTTIPAIIESEAIVRPENWRVTKSGLKNIFTDTDFERDADIRAAALWLGIQKLEKHTM